GIEELHAVEAMVPGEPQRGLRREAAMGDRVMVEADPRLHRLAPLPARGAANDLAHRPPLSPFQAVGDSRNDADRESIIASESARADPGDGAPTTAGAPATPG